MTQTVKDIAAALGAKAYGAVNLSVSGLSEPASAGPDDLALAMSPAYGDALAQGQARAAVVWAGADWQALGLEAAIEAPRARLAMSGLTKMMDVTPAGTGVSPHAVVAPTAQIGQGVSIDHFTVIGAGAVIGDGCQIAEHISIGAGVIIGDNTQIHAGVRIMRRVRIGARVVLQPNSILGADGFSFVTATPSNAETGRKTLGKTPFTAPDDPVQHRIHSLGGVVIGDDVEIGANSTVDAGTIRATSVGHGTKIDNLVQVGHNVQIGDHCLLCAQTAVAGSARIGDRTVLGGKSGVGDNLTVGTDCVIGGAAIVLSDVPSGSFMMGYPAQPMLTYRARERHLRQANIRHKAVLKPV
ncbi:MAG: UDP-3-O-[3-hydroxymyristoyl] glucosamine N-acyltransferase [Yoonia sp.]|jgi:UDP-3-O-[3-hydroxymyristoyl] glucosamine N-acyltransferase